MFLSLRRILGIWVMSGVALFLVTHTRTHYVVSLPAVWEKLGNERRLRCALAQALLDRDARL